MTELGWRWYACACGVFGALLACSAIIGTRDLEYLEGAGTPSDDAGNPQGDGAVGPNDGGTCVADLQTDTQHCGACFHDCLGGACVGGKCSAIEISSVGSSRIRYLAASDEHLFVASIVRNASDNGGLWRIPKAGGAAEEYAKLRYARSPVVFGDRVYFVDSDEPEGSAPDAHGGFYSCPVTGPAPCAPKLHKPAKLPTSIAADATKLVYGDSEPGTGFMQYKPVDAAPTVFRGLVLDPGIDMFVDGEDLYYAFTYAGGGVQIASLRKVETDAGTSAVYAYERPKAESAALIGNADSLFFTAYDFGTTTDGIVRRIPRGGGAGCSYGGTTNKRPYGVYVDKTRVYWANQGEGEGEGPWTGGSINACALAGCCDAPEIVLYSGDNRLMVMTGDDRAIYFAAGANGSIFKVAKPLP